jgi:hypothetical protein
VTTSATIPVTVTAEAAARIAELGFQGPVDHMVEYVRQHLPELTRIEVVLNERYDMGGEPGVAIEAYRRFAFDPPERTRWRIGDWLISEFPPEVREHVMIDYLPEAPDAG